MTDNVRQTASEGLWYSGSYQYVPLEDLPSLIGRDEHVVFTFDGGHELVWHGGTLTLGSGALRDTQLAPCTCADRRSILARRKNDGSAPDSQAAEGDAAQGDADEEAHDA